MPFLQNNSAGLIAVLVCLNLWLDEPAFAQRFMTTFGRVSEVPTLRHAAGVLTGDFNGDGITDVASWSETGGVKVLYQSADSLSRRTGTITVRSRILGAAAGRCNSDKYWDIVLVLEKPLSWQLYLGRKNGRFSLASEQEITEPFENILLGDIDGDGKTDILLFGKKEPGVRVYQGKGNGMFNPPVTVLKDYSYSALLITRMRSEDASDVVAANWISNQILVFSGFGKMKFSDPLVVQCPAEPSQIATAFLNADSNPDLVVSYVDSLFCETYLGDGLGGLHPGQRLQVSSPVTAISTGDINGDGRDDCGMLLKDERCLSVALNDGQGQLAETIPFAAGTSPVSFTFLRHGNTRLADAVLLDTTRSSLRMLYNASEKTGKSLQLPYAVGVRPTGVAIADVNHDGLEDVLVANTGTRNISLLLNKGNARLSGQISLSLGIQPVSIRSLVKDDSTTVLLATNPSSQKIAVLEINGLSFSHLTYELPTLGSPEILYATVDKAAHALRIYTLERESQAKPASFVKFEQIGPGRFVERTFAVRQTYPVLAAAMGDYDGDGNPDIAYVVYDTKQRKEEVFQTKGTPAEEFLPPRLITSVDLPEAAVPGLWTADLNEDGNDDLVLSLAEPENSLSVFLGRVDSTLTPSKFQVRGSVTVVADDRLKVLDINADGIPDIVLENNLNKSIEAYLGKGMGVFLPGLRLASSGNLGGFALGDLSKDMIPELIVTDTMNGYLNIYSLEE